MLIAIAAGSVVATLASIHFPCAIFGEGFISVQKTQLAYPKLREATEDVCKEVYMGLIIGSWVLTGLCKPPADYSAHGVFIMRLQC